VKSTPRGGLCFQRPGQASEDPASAGRAGPQHREFGNSVDISGSKEFGTSVAAGADLVAVGSPDDDMEDLTRAGGVCLFDTEGNFITRLQAPDPTTVENSAGPSRYRGKWSLLDPPGIGRRPGCGGTSPPGQQVSRLEGLPLLSAFTPAQKHSRADSHTRARTEARERLRASVRTAVGPGRTDRKCEMI
jgi:hypothetical protein